MDNFAERCKNWLHNNPQIDSKILLREINRFSKKLDALGCDLDKHQQQEADDIIDTLNLLEERLPAKKTKENPPATFVAEPLYDTQSPPETLDAETRAARLKTLLKNDLIQKGISGIKST